MPRLFSSRKNQKLRGIAKSISYGSGTPMAIDSSSGTLITRGPSNYARGFGVGMRHRGTELKVIDSGTVAIAAATTAGALFLVNGVSTGTDYTNRIGRKILMRSILFRCLIEPNSSFSQNTGDVIRLMLVYDTQSNSATPNVTDILNSANYLEPSNLNNRDRFLILMDKFYAVNPSTYTAGALTNGNPVNLVCKKYKKIYKETVFSGTGATSASIQSGALYLLVINQTNQVTNYSWNCRIRFEDQ